MAGLPTLVAAVDGDDPADAVTGDVCGYNLFEQTRDKALRRHMM